MFLGVVPLAFAKGEPPAAPPAAAKGTGCKAPPAPACSADKVALGPATASPFTANAGDAPALAAADVNNDGKTDLVVTHTNGSIDVMLSKGDGTFDLKNTDARVSGYGLGLVDLDGDCNVDLVFSSFGSRSVGNSVDVRLGKGTGKFALPQNFPIGVDNVVKMIFTDLNGDRRVDIAYEGNNGGAPSYNLGTGKGAFTSPTAFVPHDPWTFGDVTGDGVVDLIEVDATGARKVPSMCVRANNGRGQFADPVCYELTVNARPRFVQVADLNGDGKADVIVLTEENDSWVNVLLNLGGGKFDDREKYKLDFNCNAFLATDTNHDGKADLACYWGNTNGGLFVLHNKGDGSFGQKPEKYPLGGDSGRSEEVLVMGDWLGNGHLGFATIQRGTDAVSVISAECR